MNDRDRSQNIPTNPVRVIVDSFPPKPSPTDEEKAEKKVKKRWKIAKGILEVLALIGLWAYVRETKRTNNLTQQALDDERLHFSQTQRPWVGMMGDFTLSVSQGKDWPHYEMGYRLKNFGAAPAMNAVVPLGPATWDVNNYSLIKAEVETTCKTGENLVMLTGDLLLPGGEKPDTAQLGKKNIPRKVHSSRMYCLSRFGRKIRHTQLCYVVDSPDSKTARTCWFQSAD